MAFPAKFQCSTPTFHLQRSSPQKLSFPLFARNLAKSKPVRFPIIRASSSSNPKKNSLLKTTCITLTAAAALFSASYYLNTRPPAISPEEATLERHLEAESNDVEALLSLAKIKFEASKYGQAIEILNLLIEIEPHVEQWTLMKARIHSFNYDNELAIQAFEDILAKDPSRIEAYHYLVIEYWNSIPKLTELEKRINEAIRRCEKEKKTKEIRDLRVLIAQIRVLEGKPDEAIRICEELAKDDPEDFRIYLFQGLVYSSMNKNEEAGKQFLQVEALLPENHLYREIEKQTENDWQWSVIVDYHNTFCYIFTFMKLLMASSFKMFR